MKYLMLEKVYGQWRPCFGGKLFESHDAAYAYLTDVYPNWADADFQVHDTLDGYGCDLEWM